MKNNKLNKKCAIKIASCLVASTALFGANTNIARALDKNAVVSEKDNSDILIDSYIKEFNNLDRIYKFLGFNCKVPDYVVSGFKPTEIRTFNLLDNNKILDICYSSSSNKNQYCIEAFKGDPEEILKQFNAGKPELANDVRCSKTGKNINGILGNDMKITSVIEDLYNNSTEKQIHKYFVWQDGDICYSIKYADGNENGLKDDEIGKIAKSLKEKNKISNVNYKIEDNSNLQYISIYDKEDLEQCKKTLGYSPKLPLKVGNDITISNCNLDMNPYGVKSFKFNSYYSFNNGIIAYIQEKGNDTYGYENIKKNGYAVVSGINKKLNVDKLNISNIDVYKYIDKDDNKAVYQWKDNDIYYLFEVFYNGKADNADNIVDKFVTAKAIC